MIFGKKINPSPKYGDALKRVYTNIIEATRYNDLDGVIKALAEDPLSINMTDSVGMNALHWAAFQNNKRIASYLLDYKTVLDGANIAVDIRHEDDYGRNVVEFAILNGNKEMISLVNRYFFPQFYDPESPWNKKEQGDGNVVPFDPPDPSDN